jgi:hypothetical protein
MARIRTIKPDFFTSEQVMELKPLTRLLFIGLWPFCDDHGIHVASPKTIKAQIFPADDINSQEIQLMLDELIFHRLLVEYSSNGRHYLHVTGWERHQKIDRPSFKHPFPYEENQVVIKDSTNTRRILDERHPPEGNGLSEGNGVNTEEGFTALEKSKEIVVVSKAVDNSAEIAADALLNGGLRLVDKIDSQDLKTLNPKRRGDEKTIKPGDCGFLPINAGVG